MVGTNASLSGSKNDDGSFTGDLTLALKRGTMTKAFHLDSARVKFSL